MGEKKTILAIEDVCHRYRSGGAYVDVLDGINLKIAAGEMVEIQGCSGSGKTTLLLACGGMQKPTSGHVIVCGENLFQLSTSQRINFRASQIGYLFQTLQLVPYLNVLENLTLVKGVSKTDALRLLEQFGMTDRIHHKPDALSHGQRQRVALIRAMIHNPALIIADEPTGNLDEENARLVFQSLRQFSDSGKAVLIASHDPVLSEFSDHRYVLESQQLNAMEQKHAGTP